MIYFEYYSHANLDAMHQQNYAAGDVLSTRLVE